MPLWFWLLLALFTLPGAGLLYQWIGLRRDRRRFPPPGRFVTLDSGLRLHLADTGHGPAVWLEAGLAASSVGWRPVANAFVKAGFRVLAIDRAGYGWSDPPRTPRSLENLLGELRQAVIASGAPLPLIMAGHSFGGLLLRHYTALYPSDVAALILLDPLEPSEFHPLSRFQAARLRYGIRLSRRGAVLARFGVVRLALDLLLGGGAAIPRFLAKASSGKGSLFTDRIVGEVRKLPSDLWPVVASRWCLPQGFSTIAAYLESLPRICAAPLNPLAARNVPTGVVTAGSAPDSVRAAHAATAAAATLGRHVLSPSSGHWVQIDRPDLAVQLVTELLHLDSKQER